MAFGNITTLYLPVTANAGSSQWGTDVRKLLDSADAASDALTKTNHGTGGAITVSADPYTTATADLDQTLYGWAITPADMNSASGAKRFYPAGDHVLTIRMGHNGTTSVTGTLWVYIYRVGPSPGRTRTLLGNSNAGVNLPITSGEVTAVVTVALPEVVFDVDETVQYSFEFVCAGIAIVGRIATLFTGTQTAVVARVDTPKLGVLADTTGSSSGSVSVDGVSGKVLATIGASTGVGAASGVGASRADTTGTAAGAAVASGQGSSVAGTTGTAAGSGIAAGLASIVLGTVGTVEIGAGGAEPTVIVRRLLIVDD